MVKSLRVLTRCSHVATVFPCHPFQHSTARLADEEIEIGLSTGLAFLTLSHMLMKLGGATVTRRLLGQALLLRTQSVRSREAPSRYSACGREFWQLRYHVSLASCSVWSAKQLREIASYPASCLKWIMHGSMQCDASSGRYYYTGHCATTPPCSRV